MKEAKRKHTSPISLEGSNVRSVKKDTKRSNNTLLRLVFFFTERTLFKGIATVLFGETGELSQPESEIQVGFFYLVRLTVSTCKTNIQTNSCTDIYTANVYRDLQGLCGEIRVQGFQNCRVYMLSAFPISSVGYGFCRETISSKSVRNTVQKMCVSHIKLTGKPCIVLIF